jgi:predicted GIY-YIG superfamily endonuclease
MTTYLYRLWDEHDRLLYVGISKSAMTRLVQHQGDKHWAHEIAKVTIESVATREEALRLEKLAIQNEEPVYNVVHNASQKTLTEQLLEQWQSLNRDQRVQVIDQIEYLAKYHFPEETVSSVRLRGQLAVLALELDPEQDIPNLGSLA